MNLYLATNQGGEIILAETSQTRFVEAVSVLAQVYKQTIPGVGAITPLEAISAFNRRVVGVGLSLSMVRLSGNKVLEYGPVGKQAENGRLLITDG
jgi:hypothetical protein